MIKLHIDLETYSSLNLKEVGAYRYVKSVDFEILLISYAFDDGPIKTVDLASGDDIPTELIGAFNYPGVYLYAHNATFERICLIEYGYNIPVERWRCTLVHAAYCGLPLRLDDISNVLQFDDETAKMRAGKSFIRYFSVPCKPTKVNGGRTRNLPQHDPERWAGYIEYNNKDVEAERAIDHFLKAYPVPAYVWEQYAVDQRINDRGIRVDVPFVKRAFRIDTELSNRYKNRMRELTGLDNPNSPGQLRTWISDTLGREVDSIAKDRIPELLDVAGPGPVSEVLRLRQLISKTSTKKFVAMRRAADPEDHRLRGGLQYYGANRTGRWAGRQAQVQNLPRNHMEDLDLARNLVASGDLDTLERIYDNIPDVLSQLIRPGFIASPGNVLTVADYSAIEAVVTAWLAGEDWRLKVFRTHGKIYEASASMMFGVPIEEIGKGSDLRQRGKVAELALGFGGGVGAMVNMGAEDMGLTDAEMDSIVKRWRAKSPRIVKMWYDFENYVKYVLGGGGGKHIKVDKYKGLSFRYDGLYLRIGLPSGRELFYYKPMLKRGTVYYYGMDQVKKVWKLIDAWGGKFTENIVQAIARDLLAEALVRLERAGKPVVMHVHDEGIEDVPEENAEAELSEQIRIMSEVPAWAEGMPIKAAGYLTKYYKKD